MQENAVLSPPALHSPLPSLTQAYSYCRQVTRKSSSNFYYAFRLLPADRHNALCALYAFCRFMDDIADQQDGGVSPVAGGSRKEKLAALLGSWREELRQCYAGTPRHPISQALADVVQRFPIQQDYLAGIIDGVAMDLSPTRYATFDDLYEYCYRVASLVGLACIEIFGYRNPSARAYAVNLGIAFQLTNILRDVGEDGQRGRIYLPTEDLAHFGYAEEDMLAGVYSDAFVQLMTFEGERARTYYQAAARYLASEDQRSLVAAEAMHLIYARLLDALTARRFHVFGTRVTLAPTAKARLALTAWARGRFGFFNRS
jgi:15-cis-phytoene synthase